MATKKKKHAPLFSRPGSALLQDVLRSAGARPIGKATPAIKGQYAIRFADAAATGIAQDLSPALAGIHASPKRTARSLGGSKQLDINFSTPELGLAIGISLKSVHIREPGGGYSHNMKRNEEELRVEATGYHRRQPYAVMVAVLFLPFDSCEPSKSGSRISSFASWVRHLRPIADRSLPTDDPDRFERIYIALYEPDGSDLRFFDVRTAPPKLGPPRSAAPAKSAPASHFAAPPKHALRYPEFLEDVHRLHLQRNRLEFVWADGEEEPLDE